jgi:hypothetical protein
MFTIWSCNGRWNWRTCGIFSNSMDVAKIMQLYLQKEVMGIGNISLKKHSMTLIPVNFVQAIEG